MDIWHKCTIVLKLWSNKIDKKTTDQNNYLNDSVLFLEMTISSMTDIKCNYLHPKRLIDNPQLFLLYWRVFQSINGKDMVTVQPWPRSLLIWSRPWCRRTMDCTMRQPMPMLPPASGAACCEGIFFSWRPWSKACWSEALMPTPWSVMSRDIQWGWLISSYCSWMLTVLCSGL